MNSSSFFQQEVSFYPKLILAKLDYDSSFVENLLIEIDCSLTQEQILNTIIDIIILNTNKSQRDCSIRTLVKCLVDGSLVQTYDLEIKQLSRFFIIIADEIYSSLSGIFINSERLFKYINWTTGEIIFSIKELNENLINEYAKLYPN